MSDVTTPHEFRAAIMLWINESRASVMGCIDLRADEEAAAHMWLDNFSKAVRTIHIAPKSGGAA